MGGRPPCPRPGPGTDLPEILKEIWEPLALGARDPAAAFHIAALSTAGEHGGEVRNVVLRFCDPGSRVIACHTDRCSAKVAQLRRNPRAQWLFFDPSLRIQIRASGAARVRTDGALTERLWQEASPRTRLVYLAEEAPGTESPRPTTGIPTAYRDRDPSLEESEQGRERFAVIRCRIDDIDWLCLGDRGNVRARFHWRGDALAARWISP